MQEIMKVNNILEINYTCRGYCTLPYPNHPKGCPNFNKAIECPPKSKKIKDVFDIDKDMFFVIEKFNLKEHILKMKNKHPHWSNLQCRNLLYWQGKVRKQLKDKTEQFINFNKNKMIYTLLPEAMGVMVINTASKLGIPIEKTPIDTVFKIALAGYPLYDDYKDVV